MKSNEGKTFEELFEGPFSTEEAGKYGQGGNSTVTIQKRMISWQELELNPDSGQV